MGIIYSKADLLCIRLAWQGSWERMSQELWRSFPRPSNVGKLSQEVSQEVNFSHTDGVFPKGEYVEDTIGKLEQIF